MHICVPTYRRMEYIARSLESLARTDFPEKTHIHICDDASPNLSEVRGAVEYANFPASTIVNFTSNDANLGADRHMVKTLRHHIRSVEDQYLVLVNDDMIYHPQWLKTMLRLIGDATPIVGMATVFNAEEWHPFTKKEDWYGTKGVFGAACTAFHRDVIIHPKMHEGICGVDWTAADICNELGYSAVCTLESYANHIGIVGWNSRPERYDSATNFLGEGF